MKRMFSTIDIRLVKEQSNIMFEEVSDGIYLVIKDRMEKFNEEFVSSTEVLTKLNFTSKVAVVSKGGSSGYANFNFDR